MSSRESFVVLNCFSKLCSFLVACFTGLSDFAIKSSSSETNICVLPSCFLKGRPRGAGPLPGTLNVLLDRAGGLTWIVPPCFVQFVATVPLPNSCICFCNVLGVHFIDFLKCFCTKQSCSVQWVLACMPPLVVVATSDYLPIFGSQYFPVVF